MVTYNLFIGCIVIAGVWQCSARHASESIGTSPNGYFLSVEALRVWVQVTMLSVIRWIETIVYFKSRRLFFRSFGLKRAFNFRFPWGHVWETNANAPHTVILISYDVVMQRRRRRKKRFSKEKTIVEFQPRDDISIVSTLFFLYLFYEYAIRAHVFMCRIFVSINTRRLNL